MCYLVTGTNTKAGNQGQAVSAIQDTEADVKDLAESWLKTGIKDITIWKQIATPKIEQTIIWDD